MAVVLLVHLSDIHIEDSDSAFVNRAALIAGAVQHQLSFADKVVITITGDVANSGQAAQYRIAQTFTENLKNELASRHGKDVDVLVVPGNHDANFASPKAKARTRILKQVGTEEINSIDLEDLTDCVRIFSEFDDFRTSVETLPAENISPIWRTTAIEVGTEKLIFHCINNAWNCEIRTSPGSLGFPLHLHNPLPVKEGALRILMMHHPAHWVSSRQFRDFRRFTRECAELCLTGHEHLANAGSNNDSETGFRLYVEGAVLNERSQPNISKFTISLIDILNRTIETTEYSLDGKTYEVVGATFTQPLPERTENVPLQPEWIDFVTDIGSNVSHHSKERLELADLYVYPELEVSDDDEETSPIILGSHLSKELATATQSVLIKGDQGAGKTALLKRLYMDAIEVGLFPVYVNGARLKSSSNKELRKLIDRAIDEQYASSIQTMVKQSQPSQRLLLLDNLDRYAFPDRYMSSVIDYLNREFGRTIATTDASFDLKEVVLTDELSVLRTFEQMRLLEFGFKLRYELVSKWCNLSVNAEGHSTLDIEQTDKLISKIVGRGLVPSYPLYVLVLLQVVEVGREGELENSALGHYYEYMILHALQTRIRQEHVHEFLSYCSHFAWFLHNDHKERLTEKELRKFHQAFEDKFDLEIPFDERMKVLIEANVFLELNEKMGFRYPYIYFFFLGRYLSNNLLDEEVQQFVQKSCKNLHVRDNGNAMLFLAHHSNDRFVFSCLREAVDSKFSEVAILKFESDTERLDQLVDGAPILVFDESRRLANRHAAQGEDQRIEKHLDSASTQEKMVEREAAQKEALQLLSDVNGLIRGIEILGTALKTNFGTIDSVQKQEIIETLFNGGLRGLRVFVELFLELPEYILAELAAIVEDAPSALTEEAERAIKIKVFNVISRFSFWFVRRIGGSVGSKSIAPAVQRYIKTNDSVANQLVAMASALETPGRIPFKELQILNERVSKSPFALSILRLVAFTRMHMYKTEEAEKQQICSELGIRMSTQRAIEYRTKDTKKVTPAARHP